MDLNKTCYFLITGASRGIGKILAIECSKKLKAGSLVVLMARSSEGLNLTKNEILTSTNNKITVKTYAIDLSQAKAEDFQEKICDSLSNSNINNFHLAFIIHNAGSIGDVSKRAKELDDIAVWMVNITSKCATVPFKSFSFYCSGKAARELYFRVLAEEESDTIVLNYSPGPVDTDMIAEVQQNSIDKDIKSYFEEQIKTKAILTPRQTVAQFLKVLEEFKFKSGDHIDYYD